MINDIDLRKIVISSFTSDAAIKKDIDFIMNTKITHSILTTSLIFDQAQLSVARIV